MSIKRTKFKRGIPEDAYDYIIHGNPYTGKWSAFKREHLVDYFNGKLSSNQIIQAKSLEELSFIQSWNITTDSSKSELTEIS